MQHVPHLSALPQVLQELATRIGVDATVAVVPLGAKILPGDLIAVRHADKICDIVVAAQVEGEALIAETLYLDKAGADVWLAAVPSVKTGAARTLTVPVGDDVTYLMRLLLTVMPSAVCVSQENLPMLGRVTAIHTTYENFFTLMSPEVPASVQGERQLELTTAMMTAQTLMDSGERQVAALLRYTLDVLAQKGFKQITTAGIYDPLTMQELHDKVGKEAFLFVEVDDIGKPMRQSLRLAV